MVTATKQRDQTVKTCSRIWDVRAGTLTAKNVDVMESSRLRRAVLRLVTHGRSPKEIARTLTITERSAKFHVTSLLNKLGAENRARAAALAVQRGLL